MCIFLDESGDMDFSESGSRFYVFAIVIVSKYAALVPLQELRHQLAREGYSLEKAFHAKDDPKPRKRRVLQTIQGMHFCCAAVALEKRKAYTRITANPMYFYKLGCHFILKWLFSQRTLNGHAGTESLMQLPDNPLIVASQFGTGEQQKSQRHGIQAIIRQYANDQFQPALAFWPSISHVGLQLADYCAWAILRHLEHNDEVARYAMSCIQDKLISLRYPFEMGTRSFY